MGGLLGAGRGGGSGGVENLQRLFQLWIGGLVEGIEGLLLFLGKGDLIVGGEAHAVIVAACRRIVLRDGDADGGAVLERVGDLHDAFAVGGSADRLGDAVIAQGLGKELSRAGGVFIGQDDHRQLHTAGVGGAQHFGGAVPVGGGGNGAFRQQHIQHLDGRVDQAASVVAHVKDERLGVLVADQILDRFFKLVVGVFVEVGDFDVAGVVDHAGIDGWGDDDAAGNFRNFDILIVTAHGQAEFGACLTADFGDGALVGVVGNIDVVDLDDQVSGLDACFQRRGVGVNLGDLDKAALIFGGADADADQLACVFLLQGGIIGSGIVGGVAVGQAGDIARRDVVVEVGFIDGAVIILPDIAVDFRKLVVHRLLFRDVGDGGGKHLPREDHGDREGHCGDDEHEGKRRSKRNFLIHRKTPTPEK